MPEFSSFWQWLGWAGLVGEVAIGVAIVIFAWKQD